MLFFIAGFTFITISWSLYLSKDQKQFIFISTQGNEVLLDGNNEWCTDGLWHPEWREHENCYYYRDNDDKPAIFRVFSFYYFNPGYLINILAKIKYGFFVLPSFVVSFGLYLILLVFRLFYRVKTAILIPFQFIVVFMNFFIFTVLFYVCNETYNGRYVKTMDGVFILTGFYFLFVIFNIISDNIKNQHHEKKQGSKTGNYS